MRSTPRRGQWDAEEEEKYGLEAGEGRLLPRQGSESTPEKRESDGAKGKELAKEATEDTCHLSTLRELCEMDGRIILILAEKVSALRAENHELKLDVGLEVMAASEKWVANLEAKVEGLNAALGDAEQCCKDLEQAK
ncbi:hypothetical protein BHE74_00006348 [Ensete ventricosum]|nr:hypothetical protein BHE74_00006348 [Ensete ventricosum]